MSEVYIVIYAREDNARVEPILDELRERGLFLWDKTNLNPGENWYEVAHSKMNIASGVLIFISSAVMNSSSMHDKIEIVAKRRLDYILPVLLDHVTWPSVLEKRTPAVIVGQDAPTAAQNIITALETLPPEKITFEDEVTAALASMIADASRGRRIAPVKERKKSAFIVHGHDLDLLKQVEDHLKSVGVEPIVLVEIGGAQLSLFQKFLRWSEDVNFAIVLVSADDFGASRRQYDEPGVADRALQFRMRQNVLLELGFFYGYLGWENVFVLFRPPDKVFPNFEMPSDLAGILYDHFDPDGKWKTLINERLQNAGFPLHE